MTVTGNAFVTRATLIDDIDSKSHKMELKKAESIKLIIQRQNHTTSYLWPRGIHTHAHIQYSTKVWLGKIDEFNQRPVICQNLTF